MPVPVVITTLSVFSFHYFLVAIVGGLLNLYKFISRSPSFIPLALEKTIIVRFKYGCPPGCRCRPTASTCEPCINLPMHYKDVKQFEDCTNSAVEECVGFGLL